MKEKDLQTMNILAVGDSGAGKTCFFQYARALFATDGDFQKRKSPITEFLYLAKIRNSRGKLVEPPFPQKRDYRIGGTSYPSKYSFKLGNSAGIIKFRDNICEVLKFNFIDVQGEIYQKSFMLDNLQSNWDVNIVNAFGRLDYHALMIIIAGNKFVEICQEAGGSKIKNIVKCAAKVSEQKGNIPAFIIITHADLMNVSDIKFTDQTMVRVLKNLCITNIEHYFVNIQESIGKVLNSHSLKTPLSRFAQIPLFKTLREYFKEQLKTVPSKKGLIIPTSSDRYQSTIKKLNKFIDELSEEYRRAKAWEWKL